MSSYFLLEKIFNIFLKNFIPYILWIGKDEKKKVCSCNSK